MWWGKTTVIRTCQASGLEMKEFWNSEMVQVLIIEPWTTNDDFIWASSFLCAQHQLPQVLMTAVHTWAPTLAYLSARVGVHVRTAVIRLIPRPILLWINHVWRKINTDFDTKIQSSWPKHACLWSRCDHITGILQLVLIWIPGTITTDHQRPIYLQLSLYNCRIECHVS